MPTAQRPLSPHLQVYRPQVTSLLSIANRISGLALTAGTVFLVWQLLAAASGPETFSGFQSMAGSWLGLLALFAWSIAFFYHLAGGIRHLLWDVGYGFDLETTYRTGRLAVIATVAMTVIAWLWALAAWGGK